MFNVFIFDSHLFFFPQKVDLYQYVMASLSSDGEGIYELVVSPEYLFIAKALLCECKEQLQQLQVSIY